MLSHIISGHPSPAASPQAFIALSYNEQQRRGLHGYRLQKSSTCKRCRWMNYMLPWKQRKSTLHPIYDHESFDGAEFVPFCSVHDWRQRCRPRCWFL